MCLTVYELEAWEVRRLLYLHPIYDFCKSQSNKPFIQLEWTGGFLSHSLQSTSNQWFYEIGSMNYFLILLDLVHC